MAPPSLSERPAAAGPPAPKALPAPPAPLAARRRQAALWGALILWAIASFALVTACAIPHPPAAIGFSWPRWASVGLTLPEWGRLLGLTAAMSVGLLAFQGLLLRPLFGRGRRETTEAVFFASSIAVRAVFGATVAWFHLGPGGHDAAAVGDEGHRLPMVALFYAAYLTDLHQMISRGEDFSHNYPKMVSVRMRGSCAGAHATAEASYPALLHTLPGFITATCCCT
jgi:hypothetical protein